MFITNKIVNISWYMYQIVWDICIFSFKLFTTCAKLTILDTCVYLYNIYIYIYTNRALLGGAMLYQNYSQNMSRSVWDM